jgi:hypothetical protein
VSLHGSGGVCAGQRLHLCFESGDDEHTWLSHTSPRE